MTALVCVTDASKSVNQYNGISTELLGDLLKQKPKEEEGVDKIIVVDNAPKVRYGSCTLLTVCRDMCSMLAQCAM